MKLTIHEGHHRPRWWFIQLFPWINYNRKSMSRYVTFGMDCNYELPGTDDDLDVNKIFGTGYLWNNKESARFGWNYNETTARITIYSYVHINGQIEFQKICDVLMGYQYLMILNIEEKKYTFSVVNPANGIEMGSVAVAKSHNKKWGFNQGLYFGGNQTALDDLTVEIKKVQS